MKFCFVFLDNFPIHFPIPGEPHFSRYAFEAQSRSKISEGVLVDQRAFLRLRTWPRQRFDNV